MSTMIRLDKVKSTAHIVNGVAAVAVEQGNVVSLGALSADKEGYVVTAPVAIAADRMAIHASVGVMYDERKLEDEFTLEIGKSGRFYVMEKGDIITITDDGITNATVVGEYVIPVDTALKMVAGALAPTTQKLAFVVIDKTTLNGVAASVLEVIVA